MAADFDIFQQTERMIPMNTIASNLYTDPQQETPRRCPHCQRCVYAPEYICIRCGRDEP